MEHSLKVTLATTARLFSLTVWTLLASFTLLFCVTGVPAFARNNVRYERAIHPGPDLRLEGRGEASDTPDLMGRPVPYVSAPRALDLPVSAGNAGPVGSERLVPDVSAAAAASDRAVPNAIAAAAASDRAVPNAIAAAAASDRAVPNAVAAAAASGRAVPNAIVARDTSGRAMSNPSAVGDTSEHSVPNRSAVASGAVPTVIGAHSVNRPELTESAEGHLWQNAGARGQAENIWTAEAALNQRAGSVSSGLAEPGQAVQIDAAENASDLTTLALAALLFVSLIAMVALV
jgi:hypothetical protein